MGTSGFLHELISSVNELRTRFGAAPDKRSIEKLCLELKNATNFNAIKRLGAIILERYQTLNDEEKFTFFKFLVEKMDLNPDRISELAQSYKSQSSASNLNALLIASEPPRQELLRRLNHVPNATGVLVSMRADLLKMIKEHELLKRLDLDFASLFLSWFNLGFLVEKPISWDSSASVLAKIIQYEAVHAINDWDDLRRRIQPPDRRCFAFFHPAMPNEPLVFVEIALSKGIPNSVQEILEKSRKAIDVSEADTAVFYSISNCQAGLRGISFGNSLIKQVATNLARDFPQISTFITLSPIPGFANWLHNNTDISADQLTALEAARSRFLNDANDKEIKNYSHMLKSLAARYLYNAKRGDGMPIDQVARFHLNNGASLYDIHAMADVSPNGLQNSFAIMVNYLYDLKKIETYHEDFASNGKINKSKTIRQLAESPIQMASINDTKA